jgi:hypothetical protein
MGKGVGEWGEWGRGRAKFWIENLRELAKLIQGPDALVWNQAMNAAGDDAIAPLERPAH